MLTFTYTRRGTLKLNSTFFFRDYLRNHPEVRNEYAELKGKLLQENLYMKKIIPLSQGII